MKTLTSFQRRRAAKWGLGLAIVGDMGPARECFRAAFTGQWEGNERNRNRNRPPRRTAAQDTDLNYGVREDLLSEARSLVQTEPIAKRVANQFAEYCVGKCHARWNLGDDPESKKIAKLYRQNWKDWMKVADYRGLHQFPKLMKISVSEGAITTGDMFMQKVLAPGNRAMVNMIEADRVSSSGIFNTDSDSMVGGIGLDPQTRRHKFIRVWERTLYGTFKNPLEIPKSDYFHFFDSNRIDAARGITAFFAVLNATRDKKEINTAETLKTKRNSKLAIVAKVLTGQAPPTGKTLDLTGEGFDGDTTQQKIQVEDINDAATAYIFPNEEIKAHESNTPSSAWQGHMEFIIRNIAIGCNLPFGVVWNMAGLGKPGVLFELEQAARTFSSLQDELESRFILPTIGWVTSVEIAAGRLPFHPKWYNYKVSRPAYISIDAGRDSKSAIAENLMGMKSATRWYAESGDEFEEEFEDCCREEAFRREMCAQYKVEYSNVRQMTPNGNTNSDGDSNKQSESE